MHCILYIRSYKLVLKMQDRNQQNLMKRNWYIHLSKLAFSVVEGTNIRTSKEHFQQLLG